MSKLKLIRFCVFQFTEEPATGQQTTANWFKEQKLEHVQVLVTFRRERDKQCWNVLEDSEQKSLNAKTVYNFMNA